MIVFALDSYGKNAGVALWRDDGFLYETTLAAGLTHSETLLPLCAEAFRATGLTPKEVDLFGVCAGPGSFTGLRIGLATVKGLALPHKTPAAGVSTLLAAALASGAEGTVVAALDARRNEVYWAAFQIQNGVCTRLAQDAAGPLPSLEPFLLQCAGPISFVGDGAALCHRAFGALPGVLPLRTLMLPMAAGAALAALQMQSEGGACEAEALRPCYHRLSQAERELAEKNKKELKSE